ncbi:organic cation transporter protein [Plutella xylostella]|uniref:organic cation transporter protein n=1 Tax=Plutella xylostella TaxID=51655 RepID=UPI0020324806|nr:organic cation transporter protein [Plutella xylostella]
MALLKLPVAWYHMNIIFLAPPQDFWCRKPEMLLNVTEHEWREIFLPKSNNHSCFYDAPIISNESLTNRSGTASQVNCRSFDYDTSVFNRTIISDWDLVCSNRWLVHLSQIVLMLGILLGGILFGALADRYGRKHPLMAAIIIQSVCGFSSGTLSIFWVFLLNRFVLALSTGGIAVMAFVLCMEVVSGKWRTIVPVLCQLPFGLGAAIMSGMAYWWRDWRKLEFSLGCLSSLYVLYWFWIPESPRWLLATGQTEKALGVLRDAAKKNKRPFNINDVNLLLQQKAPATDQPRFTAFLKSPNMRRKTFLLSLNWLVTGIAYYTFAQYLGALGDNIFLTVATSGVISTPGAIISIYVLAKLGRKATIGGFQLLTCLCFVLLLVVPKNLYVNDWPRLLCAGVGMAGMAGSIPALYLFTAELYPTIGRNVGVGGVSIFARVGSMIAPLFVGLDEIMENLTLIVLACMSLAQILLVVPLPDTRGYPLPATLEEAEGFTRRQRKDYFKEQKDKNHQSETLPTVY